MGGIVQCGQIFLQAATLYSDNVADWLQWRDGSVLMVLTTAFIFPVRPGFACHEHHCTSCREIPSGGLEGIAALNIALQGSSLHHIWLMLSDCRAMSCLTFLQASSPLRVSMQQARGAI